MTIRNGNELVSQPAVHGGTWGNLSVAVLTYGPVSSVSKPGTNGDVIRFAKLQEETKLIDAILITDVNSAAATIDLGYTSVAGSDTDADYFLAAQSIATAGKFRANRGLLVKTLVEDAYLTATIGGATIADTVNVQVILLYQFVGTN